MFNIKRFDPTAASADSTSTTTSIDGLDSLNQKIQERKRKRLELESSTSTESTTTTAPGIVSVPIVSTSVVEEWKPAAGESPAEREKREKREKRALKLGSMTSTTVTSTRTPLPDQDYSSHNGYGGNKGVSFDLVPMPASGSTYTGEREDGEGMTAGGAGAIHPDRLRHVPGAKKEKKEKDLDKEKTPAKKKYLKRKKSRSKGKKAGEPSLKPKRIKLSAEALEAERLAGFVREEGDSESSSSEEDEDEIKEKEEKLQQKKLDIIKKKEERKQARDVKKQAARDLRATGAAPLPIVARVLPSVSTIVLETEVEMEVELSPEAILKQERLAAKRQKREERRQPVVIPSTTKSIPTPTSLPSTTSHSSPPPSTSHLIPTAPITSTLPTLPLPSPSPEPEKIPLHLQSADPVPLASSGPFVEPEPLLRLPGATRPQAPSAKELGELRIHGSVREKMIIESGLKISLSEGEKLGVSERGVKRLGEMGVTEAFAVQTAVFPFLLPEGVPRALYAPFSPPRDLCVSAPTGSGKTLSYVVPIVETLGGRVVTRLRALILLPTRDLVAQVKETFESFGKGTGLKIGTATGQHSFAHEQLSLVGELAEEDTEVLGGVSQVDILIATPGRLMDHLRSTKGFSLQHLRYLVIDEADRLLNQSFHDWLPSILASLKPTTAIIASTTAGREDKTTAATQLSSSSDCLAPEWWDREIGRVNSDVDERCKASCQKLLFSATLSRDPAKIDALHLHRPVYVSVEDELDLAVVEGEDAGGSAGTGAEVDEDLKFTLPATLKEHMIVSPSSHKPLYLFHLLHTLSVSSALCFTKSVEAASRLTKLVEFFEEAKATAELGTTGTNTETTTTKKVVVSSYSSDLPNSERTRILNSFKKGEIQMLICSDLISRGIDLPHVSHVISYDVPSDMRKYVHRVGRTARAGKEGDAWSLVENQEAAPFKAIMTSAGHFQKIERVRVKDQAVEPFVPHYQVALKKLKLHFTSGKSNGGE